jgi:hypothetical protein
MQATTCERCGRPIYDDRPLCRHCDPGVQPLPLRSGEVGGQRPERNRRTPKIAIAAGCLVAAIAMVAGAWGLHLSGLNNAPTQTIVRLVSDPGDYVGAGGIYVYTPANARISVKADGCLLTVEISGKENWTGEFQVPDGLQRLQRGKYTDLQAWPFNDRSKGGLDWSGEGRGENTLSGWFAIDYVSYEYGSLTAIDLRFEQHGEDRSPALHGEIQWSKETSERSQAPTTPEATRAPQEGAPDYDKTVFKESIGKVVLVLDDYARSIEAWHRAGEAIDSRDPSTFAAFERATQTRVQDAGRELADVEAIMPPPGAQSHWQTIVSFFQAELTYDERMRDLRADPRTDPRAQALAAAEHVTAKRLWNTWLTDMQNLAHWEHLDIRGLNVIK